MVDATLARYEYIAESDPYASLSVLNKYGLSLQGDNISNQDIGQAIEQMVASNGEPALTDIMAIHPDKGIIVELFGSTYNSACQACVTAALAAKPSTCTTSPAACSNNGGVNMQKFLNNPTNVMLLGIGIVVFIIAVRS